MAAGDPTAQCSPWLANCKAGAAAVHACTDAVALAHTHAPTCDYAPTHVYALTCAWAPTCTRAPAHAHAPALHLSFSGQYLAVFILTVLRCGILRTQIYSESTWLAVIHISWNMPTLLSRGLWILFCLSDSLECLWIYDDKEIIALS